MPSNCRVCFHQHKKRQNFLRDLIILQGEAGQRLVQNSLKAFFARCEYTLRERPFVATVATVVKYTVLYRLYPDASSPVLLT